MGGFDTKVEGDDVLHSDWNEHSDALGGGNPVGLPDWVIFYHTGDAEYKARNMYDGTIDYNGTNGATVIQAVIDGADNNDVIYCQGQIDIGATLTFDLENDPYQTFIFNRLRITADNIGLDLSGASNGCSQQTGKLIGNELYSNVANYSKAMIKVTNVKNFEVNIRSLELPSAGAAGSMGFHLLGNGAAGAYFLNTIKFGRITYPEIGIKFETSGGAFNSINRIYGGDLLNTGTHGIKHVGTNCGSNIFNGVYVHDVANGDYGFYDADYGNTYVGCGGSDGLSGAIEFYTAITDYDKMSHLIGCSKSSAATITGTFKHFNTRYHPPRVTIEHHTAADTLTKEEHGSVHTNLGASGNIKLTLPQDAVTGTEFEFVVLAAHQLQVDAGAAGAIYINGAKSADDAYIWADDEGESVKLIAEGNGDWAALYTQGTWTVV